MSHLLHRNSTFYFPIFVQLLLSFLHSNCLLSLQILLVRLSDDHHTLVVAAYGSKNLTRSRVIIWSWHFCIYYYVKKQQKPYIQGIVTIMYLERAWNRGRSSTADLQINTSPIISQITNVNWGNTPPIPINDAVGDIFGNGWNSVSSTSIVFSLQTKI